jgi:hypothetical protein
MGLPGPRALATCFLDIIAGLFSATRQAGSHCSIAFSSFVAARWLPQGVEICHSMEWAKVPIETCNKAGTHYAFLFAENQ